MQVSVESVNAIERRLTIEVPAERVDSAVDKRLQDASRSVRIDGFRPGKVPMSVIKKRYGAGIREEVLGQVVQETLMEAMTQEELNPAGRPNVEPTVNESGKNFTYTATFEVYPEVSLTNFGDITVTQLEVEIQESDIDDMIEKLRDQRKTYEKVERAAANDDRVNIAYQGALDGEPFEGGSSDDQALVLGSNRMIPGFEEGVVGMSAGDTKSINLTFPEDYQAEELAGKEVVFEISVKDVEEAKLPELDDELFAVFGVKEGGVEAFRKEVRANMDRELVKALRARVKNQIVDALVDKHEVELPKSLVSQEIERLKQEMLGQFGGGAQMDPSALPDHLFEKQAENRVKSGLIINQYVKDREIEQDNDKVKQLVEEAAAPYDDPQEVINYIFANEDQLNQFRSLALEEQVIDAMLEEVATATETASYEDALKAPEPEEAA